MEAHDYFFQVCVQVSQVRRPSCRASSQQAFQFYPENEEQLEMITNAAIKCGFSGGLVVDYPNSALAKKYYLVLSTEHQGKLEIKVTTGKDEDDEELSREDEDTAARKQKDIRKRIALQ